MENKLVNFSMPNPYQTDMAELARRQRMAEMLQQQAAEPVQKFGYGGIEVPISPLAGLAKALNAYSGRQMERDVLKEQKELGERYRADQATDMQTLIEALKPREAQKAYPASEESFGVIPAGIAKEAKPAGALEPSVFGSDVLKTPEMRNFAFQQYLSQLAPKAPIKVGAGEALINPSTFTEVYRAPKDDFSPPVREQLPDGSIVTVAYDKAGNRKVIDTGGAKPAVSADTEARLKQEREISDRAFNNLSAAQQQQARQEAQRIGISLSDFNLRKFQADNPQLHIVQSGESFAGIDPRTGLAKPITVQGTGAGAPTPLAGPAKPPTEDQAKAAGFANRMLQANDVIEKLNFQPTRIGNIASAIPGSNFLLPSERQQAEQAQRNFINAILRRESGAAIAPSEFESAAKQYFPQPGDKPEVLEQKRQNRALAIQGLQQGAGTSYKPYVPPTIGVKFLGFE